MHIEDIKELIKLEGGIGLLSAKLGVDFSTVYRWSIGTRKPTGLALKSLLKAASKYFEV